MHIGAFVRFALSAGFRFVALWSKDRALANLRAVKRNAGTGLVFSSRRCSEDGRVFGAKRVCRTG